LTKVQTFAFAFIPLIANSILPVEAYPDQMFWGVVDKIEPQATLVKARSICIKVASINIFIVFIGRTIAENTRQPIALHSEGRRSTIIHRISVVSKDDIFKFPALPGCIIIDIIRTENILDFEGGVGLRLESSDVPCEIHKMGYLISET